MNRRERRAMQRDLGLNKHYKRETREAKWERWRDNMENGKFLMEEAKERNRVLQNMSREDKESQEIALLAQKIAAKKEIPFVDAMTEAREKYESNK